MSRPAGRRDGGQAGRRYPPLVPGLIAVAMAAFVLPSALNVPLSNPTQTLEFAPVPPEDDAPPPPQGSNLQSLSLGTSAGPAGDTPGSAGPGGVELPPPVPVDGAGARPVTKRCVGDPPRQTEDPMSPPCVAHFEGDNFGATYPGVDQSEVRVLFYFDGCCGQVTGRGMETIPTNTIDDLGEPPEDPDEFVYSRLLRAYQRYFNERFQTYGRFVHFYVHYGSSETTPEARRADAAEGIRQVAPLASISFAGANSIAYLEAMASQGVVSFHGLLSGISSTGYRASLFETYPGLLWSHIPSLEQRARLFTSYVCTKVVGHTVSFSGNDDTGQPRKLGLIRRDLDTLPDMRHFGLLVKAGIEGCNGEFAAEGTYGEQYYPATSDPANASTNMATFLERGVTTVIFATATDTSHSRAAESIGYTPEWIIAGDYIAERPLQSRLQNQEQWRHARVVTPYPAVVDVDDQYCIHAYRSVDPHEGQFQVRNYACDFYWSVLQLFTGVQVAGPRLTPTSIDQGFHAIPAIRSTDPAVPACFYEPGDYTCVKDAQAQWWDPDGQTPGSNQPGCMRMMERGARYLAGGWPPGDVEEQRGDATTDPCNAQGPDVA